MTFNANPQGRGFTVPAPLEDRTVELPQVQSVPAPVMAAPDALTPEHRKALDEIDTLAREARRHLSGWDGRGADDDPAAESAMGWALAAIKQLLKVGRELQGALRFEDAVTAVDDGREAYEVEKARSDGGA